MIRFDFSCSGKCKKERDDGAAVVYPDLPATTTRCPVCGSKRVTKLFTNVNVAHGVAKHVDALVGPQYEHQKGIKDSAKRHETLMRRADDWERVGLRVGPASDLGKLAAEATGMGGFAALSAGDMKSAKASDSHLMQPLGRPAINHPAGGMVAGNHPRPAPGSPKWSPPGKG
jgi:DNA-directed RNA polymerase subunit RPC12/RpoP